jgi:hypothetical protein
VPVLVLQAAAKLIRHRADATASLNFNAAISRQLYKLLDADAAHVQNHDQIA